jgi:hypothetical protein
MLLGLAGLLLTFGLILLGLLSGLAGASIAKAKGRSGDYGFVLGVVLGPIGWLFLGLDRGAHGRLSR